MLASVTEIDRRIATYHQELVRFLRRRVPGDPEEAAQEVWLRVARADPDCPDDPSFRAYAYTVARRLVIDMHRRRRARIELVSIDDTTAERTAAGGQSPDGRIEASEVLKVVQDVLADMKPEMAEVFRLRTLDDVPFKDIAERQGCSINTALGRHHRATKKIAAALEAAGLTGGAA